MSEPNTTDRTASNYTPESDAASSTSVAPKTSLWEDFIDIFYAPSQVFARRAKDGSAWPPFLVVAVGTAIVTLLIANAIEPVMQAEISRQVAAQIAKNPQAAAQADAMRAMGMKFAPIAAIFAMPVIMLVLGFFTWLVGKFFDAKLSFGQGMLIAAYAYVPRLLFSVLMGVQALTMDMTNVKGMMGLTFSPARFFDPGVTSAANLAVLARFDVFTLWSTAIVAIGVSVVGRVSRGKGWGTAATLWFLATVMALLGALRQG